MFPLLIPIILVPLFVVASVNYDKAHPYGRPGGNYDAPKAHISSAEAGSLGRSN